MGLKPAHGWEPPLQGQGMARWKKKGAVALVSSPALEARERARSPATRSPCQ